MGAFTDMIEQAYHERTGLCGVFPCRTSTGWQYMRGSDATCPRCKRKLLQKQGG